MRKIGGYILIVLGVFSVFIGVVNIEDILAMPDNYATNMILEMQDTTKGELWFKTIFISIVGIALLAGGFIIKKEKKN